MDENIFTNSLNFTRGIVKEKLSIGDVAVDATMGNGNDTIFMSQLVGKSGKVYSFDIQEQALTNTKENIKKNNIKVQIELILDGHENMDKYIKEKVKVVMFNLGYLPKGNHDVTTKRDTTLIALQKSLKLLNNGGIIAIVIYHGHEEGKNEKLAIENFVAALNQKEFNVVKFQFINQINNPPIFIGIERRIY